MRTSIIAALGLLLAAITGCEKVESTDINTSGVWANISASGGADGKSTVATTLKVGGATSNTYLELVGGDSLVASSGSQSVTMSAKQEFGNVVTYHATLDGAEEGKEVKVAFKRDVDPGAPSSTVKLPAPFTLSAPAANASISRNGSLTVTWNAQAGGSSMHLSVSGDCIDTYSRDLDSDSGSYTVNAGDIKEAASRTGESCKATVEVKRSQVGQLDPAYGEGGKIFAYQSRSVEISSTP